MARRRCILLLALITATLVYLPVFYALLRRAMYVLFPRYSAGRVHRYVPDDYFGLPPLVDGYDVHGYFVPLWMIVGLWCLLPAIWAGFEIFYCLRRHRRDRLGQCIECGCHLKSHRGCCPSCGTRVGPGLPSRRYVLNMPRDV